MVLEIRISNFFSIKEEVCIDFRAANIKSANALALSDNVFKHNDTKVLKTIVMYGANASGKSNVIKAIRFCNAMVFGSHMHNENSTFNFHPFKFDGYNQKPGSYFIRFVSSDIEFEYSFSLTQTQIVTESLHYYPKGRIKEIFTRDERRGKSKSEIYSFGDVIKRPMDVAENTSNKTLFVSRASQMDRDIPKEIFNYFHSRFILQYPGFGKSMIEHLSKENKEHLMEVLKFADSDIIDVKFKSLKHPGKNFNANLDTLTLTVEEVIEESIQITTYHKRNPRVGFNFLAEESQGTIKLFFIMLAVLDIVKHNKILLIDEIEESLHPRIIEYIFNFFRASKRAQLLCTTHNTRFLNLKKMRKDQIYFINKKEDASTDVYSLYDYSDFRDTMNLEKAYLQGRFDAVPILEDSLETIKSILDE
ncbi:MAG: ATP-binding protein [Balneolales bacterium]|nr:ATP-binding protein [Balneolales bacterium]